ncbi:hypothetical protein D3C72_2598540 [compost metagenome]
MAEFLFLKEKRNAIQWEFLYTLAHLTERFLLLLEEKQDHLEVIYGNMNFLETENLL